LQLLGKNFETSCMS